ncbi:hypothetical protein CHS0354_037702 [Potamilus streckersoni]|uniref:Heat shock 70 kDa protein 13 n=1 Tax=Potamilus streckersoni TaxID=2493646 RepID=A0AAE0T0B1_9BIVA|nr:hypothetical protein CHS0354_037702 [Potamilus streckersoni]
MSSNITCIILGTSILALLLAGYLAQKYLPPPKPKIVGIDLGTTYSCVGLYHAVTGEVDILDTQDGHKCIPSVVAFSENGILVGYHAEAQAEHNPNNTIYDAKRFIGKKFSKEELQHVQKQYSFKLELDEYGMVRFVISVNKTEKYVTPEDVGSIIISTLRKSAEHNLSTPVTKVVMSVPAEFDIMQRNYTKKAGTLAGLEVFRIINEPTAAALAYGLHRVLGFQNVMVIDLGGGTLDVSILNVQGGMFLTLAMAGNNRLGGQDFNQRLIQHFQGVITQKYGKTLTDREDLQSLRHHVENLKLHLTTYESFDIQLPLYSMGTHVIFKDKMTRTQFEDLNIDLFKKVLEPIEKVLEAVQLPREAIDEVILVGGSTRIPKVRELIQYFFNKPPNVSVDPELAVVVGVSIQAGIIGGMWPLTVSAVEAPVQAKKIQLN